MNESTFSPFNPELTEQHEAENELALVEQRYTHLFSEAGNWEQVSVASGKFQEIRAGFRKSRMDRIYGAIDKSRKNGQDFLQRIDLTAAETQEYWKAMLGGEMKLSDEYLPRPVVKEKLQENEHMGTACVRIVRPDKDKPGGSYELDIVGITRDGKPVAVLLYSGEKHSDSQEIKLRKGELDPILAGLARQPAPAEVPIPLTPQRK